MRSALSYDLTAGPSARAALEEERKQLLHQPKWALCFERVGFVLEQRGERLPQGLLQNSSAGLGQDPPESQTFFFLEKRLFEQSFYYTSSIPCYVLRLFPFFIFFFLCTQ